MVQIGPAIVMVGNLAANLEGEHAISPERRTYLHNNRWGVGMTPFLKDVVEDMDTFYHKLKEKGVTISEPVHTTSYGWKMFGVEDPDGYVLMFANQEVE
ncbi:VOC family protein [Marinithermofilum abyssi]|nr:VOC family protein [Marinithermofilum abyssi]